MDKPEIDIALGELQILHVVHGTALNAKVVPYEEPSNWFFRQFASEQEMREFATHHSLRIVMERKE